MTRRFILEHELLKTGDFIKVTQFWKIIENNLNYQEVFSWAKMKETAKRTNKHFSYVIHNNNNYLFKCDFVVIKKINNRVYICHKDHSDEEVMPKIKKTKEYYLVQKYAKQINKIMGYGAFNVEHVIPIALGGTHHIKNLQLMEKMCNIYHQHKTKEKMTWFEQITHIEAEIDKMVSGKYLTFTDEMENDIRAVLLEYKKIWV